MVDTPERVTQWARLLDLSPSLSDELVNIMLSVPETARETILNDVIDNRDKESHIRFCAESILKFSAPVYSGVGKRFSPGTDSLLALVPELAPTYSAFDVRPDAVSVFESFQKVLRTLTVRRDTPSDFLFDRDLESHLVPEMHGILISCLATNHAFAEDDMEWLGNHRDELAPSARVLYERDTIDQDFCRTLMSNAQAVAEGTL